jgi:hypothetical protein
MTLFSCGTVRRRLQAFHDRELPVRDLIAIESHVADCSACSAELSSLRLVGDALRLAAAPAPADDWTGVQSSVISRMKAEAHESWTAKTGRLFDDLHLVWIGLASTVATFLCAAVALSALHFASPERDDSLAAMIDVISAPAGSDLNPLRVDHFLQFPSVPERGAIEAMLAQPISREELTLALSAVVTREGRVSGLSVLTRENRPSELSPILDVLSRSRLEPGRLGASPVAVNLVWLLTHTTVRAKAPPRTI